MRWLVLLSLVGCQHHSGQGSPTGCPSGSHESGGSCVLDQGCTPDSCSGHGSCSESGGVATCACDNGFAPPTCAGCATGLHSDGMGGCSGDPCTPNPCSGANRSCVVASGMATCACAAGLHDDSGVCVPDTTCAPTSCNGHGTCMAGTQHVTCQCDAGWSGAACADCDSVGGYHSDGMGGCTQDPCTPNPCSDAHRTQCQAQMGSTVCGCDAGYHLEGPSCVADESCAPASCSGHGSCSVVGGHVQCACTAGYTGSACAACDSGYHDDGAGGCTQDPCTPNPCALAHKTVCTSGLCGCDSGYHDDGAGGCTQDPCTPNPCLASDQACQVVSGSPQCYTPPCDDANPCTDDAVVGGGCTHTPRSNGTSCQTSLCLSGESCSGGVCGGGSPRSCDDSNPCTDDSCSPTAGCQHANDDALVPSDGKACTVDKCVSGVASHTSSDAACDDGKWCTGSEVCDPAGQGADAAGCRHTNVPTPPIGLGPCRSAGSCDEMSHSFPLSATTAGTPCNDGLGCSTGDQCDGSGACHGVAVPGCSEIAMCSSTTPLMSSIDVPWGELHGTFTSGGQPLPPTFTDYGETDFYLKARDTGVLHYIGYVFYSYTGGSPAYSLYSGTYSARVVTGVYDLIYSRGCNASSSSCTVKNDGSLGPFANGYRTLMQNLVIGPGSMQLDIDVPIANLSGNFTVGGQPLPATFTDYGESDFYLKARDTGMLHYIGYIFYSYTGGTPAYSLYSGNYNARLLPGVYDLVYSRGCNASSTSCTVKNDGSLGPFANGYRLLQSGVTIVSGDQTLNIDIPIANLSGNFTAGGQPLPAGFTDYGESDFYLKARDTGMLHYIGYIFYSYTGGSPAYSLYSGNYTARLLPGVYDLIYSRGCNASSTSCTVKNDGTLGPFANGYRLLQSGVTIAAGDQTLNIDVPTANLSGNFTVGGQPLPATFTDYGESDFYLKARDTGLLHYIGYIFYSYTGGSPAYSLYSGNYNARLLPGVYDLIYSRGCNASSTSCTVKNDGTLGPFANGYRLLQSGVTIAAGDQTLNIDVPIANLSGNFTVGGQPLPAKFTDYGESDFYLKARDTGLLHYIGYIFYSYTGGSPAYSLYSGSYTARLLPGVYDLVYSRGCNASSSSCTVKNDGTLGPFANGYRLLQSGVTISAGSQTMDIDVPTRDLSGAFTVAEQPLPASFTDYGESDFYLKARDTSLLHYIGYIFYSYTGGSPAYSLYSGSYTARLLPGVYDLVYSRGCNAGSTCNVKNDGTLGPFVNGYRLLSPCALVP